MDGRVGTHAELRSPGSGERRRSASKLKKATVKKPSEQLQKKKVATVKPAKGTAKTHDGQLQSELAVRDYDEFGKKWRDDAEKLTAETLDADFQKSKSSWGEYTTRDFTNYEEFDLIKLYDRFPVFKDAVNRTIIIRLKKDKKLLAAEVKRLNKEIGLNYTPDEVKKDAYLLEKIATDIYKSRLQKTQLTEKIAGLAHRYVLISKLRQQKNPKLSKILDLLEKYRETLIKNSINLLNDAVHKSFITIDSDLVDLMNRLEKEPIPTRENSVDKYLTDKRIRDPLKLLLKQTVLDALPKSIHLKDRAAIFQKEVENVMQSSINLEQTGVDFNIFSERVQLTSGGITKIKRGSHPTTVLIGLARAIEGDKFNFSNAIKTDITGDNQSKQKELLRTTFKSTQTAKVLALFNQTVIGSPIGTILKEIHEAQLPIRENKSKRTIDIDVQSDSATITYKIHFSLHGSKPGDPSDFMIKVMVKMPFNKGKKPNITVSQEGFNWLTLYRRIKKFKASKSEKIQARYESVNIEAVKDACRNTGYPVDIFGKQRNSKINQIALAFNEVERSPYDTDKNFQEPIRLIKKHAHLLMKKKHHTICKKFMAVLKIKLANDQYKKVITELRTKLGIPIPSPRRG